MAIHRAPSCGRREQRNHLRWIFFLGGFVLLAAVGVYQRSVRNASGLHSLRLETRNKDDQCVNPEDCLDACECVKQNHDLPNLTCHNDAGFLDYDRFLFCVMGKDLLPVSIIILSLWGAFLIYVLVTTTEDYFLPTLSDLSNRFRLSSNLAGVTFLAIGNGAPDVIASVSATVHGSGGLAISAVLGGAVFVVTVVVGAVCMTADVSVTRRPFLRDILSMAVAVAVVFAVLLPGEIAIWETVILLALYAVYIAIVIVGRYMYQRFKKQKREVFGIVEDMEDESDAEEMGEMDTQEAPEGMDVSFADYDDGDIDEILLLSDMRSWRRGRASAGVGDRVEEHVANGWRDPPKQYLQWIIATLSWKERSLQEKIAFVLTSPVKLLQNLTIPLLSETSWSKLFALFNPPCGLMLIMAGLGLLSIGIPAGSVHIPVWPFVLVVGITLSIVIFFTSSLHEPPKYYVALICWGFFMSAIWMYIASTELICVLRAVGQVLNLSEEIIGLSVVAWGNSVVDLVANTIISKNGFPGMAFSACFGSPIFNLLIGTSVPAAYMIVSHGFNPFLVHTSHILIASFCTIAVAIVSTLLLVPMFRFQVPATYGIYLFILYFVFLAVAGVIEILAL